MGYRRKRKLIHLTFTGDPELEGLEVTMTSLPLGEFMELMGLDEVTEANTGDQLRRFARALISWNLEEEDGTPVPATVEAVMAEDHDHMLTVASHWMDAIRGVKENSPLPEGSPSGGPSLEASIPMETVSPSLAS